MPGTEGVHGSQHGTPPVASSLRTLSGYAIAVGAAAFALAVRVALNPILGGLSPYLPATLAVLVAARFGGRLPGLVATALSALGVVWFLVEPYYSLALTDPTAIAGVIVFLAVGSLISLLVGQLRQSFLVTARAEETLRGSKERLRIAHQAARIGAFEWNIQTGVNVWTPELEAMYGLPPGGFPGTEPAWESLVYPDDRADAIQRLKEACESGAPGGGEWRVVWPDGSVHWLVGRWQVFKDAAGTPLRMIGVNIDITERKQKEEALRQALADRDLALKAANLGTWNYRFDTGDVLWDERSWHMFGLTPEVGMDYPSVISLIHAEDREAVGAALSAALAGASGGKYHQEFRVVWPDGSLHWIAGHGQVFFEAQGGERRAVRFAGVNMDVTERRRKMETVGRLAAGVAHDFNNLLTVIMGNASSALAQCPACQQSQAILSASERAADLTRQLLAYAGKGEFVIKTFDLSDLVSNLVQLISASVPKRVSVSYNLTKNLLIDGDPSRVEQILMNLATNAYEAIPPENAGRVEIATGSCSVTPEIASQHSQVFEAQTGPHVFLEVRDNGAGMDKSTMSRIFDPFFSTKFLGRGLGLAAVQGIVRSSKGFIDVDSTPGSGSTFRVLLPASESERSTEALPWPAGVSGIQRGDSTAILVVEDEEMVRQLACMTLRAHGYHVLEAKDGREALQVLANSAAAPALVLLDLAMPVMGGDELVPILKQRYPGLKIVVSSGFPEDDVRRSFPPGSVAGFLQKPYAIGTLLEKVGECVPERAPAL